MAALPPVPQPIGVFPQFFAAGPETVVLREKVLSLTGDNFSIKLANGTPILQVEGKVMSISGRKKVTDMQGNHLFSIVKEHFHIHATYAAESPSGEKLLEVKSHFALLGSKATATFTSQNGKHESLTMRGNWLDTSADIVDEAQGDIVVARINRKLLSGKDIFFGQQTYGVHVAPGVDMALIAALCICLDEKNNEQKHRIVVARVHCKRLSGKDVFIGRQNYGVHVAPGVDMALIAALGMCLDEMNYATASTVDTWSW